MQGDVIVDVVIGQEGNITDLKLMQGIDEKVLATLRQWRFTPARRGGSPIPSQHEMRFPYPA